MHLSVQLLGKPLLPARLRQALARHLNGQASQTVVSDQA